MKPERPEWEKFKRKDGSYPPRTTWPAPTYDHWYPAPFPGEEGGKSVAEKLENPPEKGGK